MEIRIEVGGQVLRIQTDRVHNDETLWLQGMMPNDFRELAVALNAMAEFKELHESRWAKVGGRHGRPM